MASGIRLGIVAVLALSTLACTNADSSTSPSVTAPTATPNASPSDISDTSDTSTDPAPTTSHTGGGTPTTGASGSAATAPTAGAGANRPDCPTAGVPATPDGPAVELIEVGTGPDVGVRAALYPVPDDRGAPWSQWGQGVVLPDGRFVSAVGDHLGVDGNSWFFEYDPSSGTLTRTTEVASALGHQSGDWGYGKIHAPLLLGPCDEVLAATYWGTRRDLVVGGSYQGDHLIRYDPARREVASLGVPVPGFGVPSLAISPDRRFLYGEAVDPASDPDAGPFFVADAVSGDVILIDDDPAHVGFRSVLVTADGAAWFAAGDAQLFRHQQGSDGSEIHGHELPGTWLRAASPIAPDGTVFGATRDPDHLFRLDVDGTISDLGPVGGYVASLGLAPDGRTVYYVPDAHGGAWRQGTPLIAFDTETGEQRVVVELNPMIEDALDVRAGGTYNVVVDPTGRYVYVGLNTSLAGDSDREPTFGSVVLAVVELGG